VRILRYEHPCQSDAVPALHFRAEEVTEKEESSHA
jgi:hypothetical protein